MKKGIVLKVVVVSILLVVTIVVLFGLQGGEEVISEDTQASEVINYEVEESTPEEEEVFTAEEVLVIDSILEVEYEVEGVAYGIDVSQFQGVIDWEAVASDGVEYAIIRVGSSSIEEGILQIDECARYNLQEANKYGIPVGCYFFSTAITEEEILEEVSFLTDIIDDYEITYPVVYNCELYDTNASRQQNLTTATRSALADYFLELVEDAGYIGMFYASLSEMENSQNWDMELLESKYRVWVAQYPYNVEEYPVEDESSYSRSHVMWQYSTQGNVEGISQPVDLNVSYVMFTQTQEAKSSESPEQVLANYEVGVLMTELVEQVTAKDMVNVRSTMSQVEDNIIGQLYNGEIVTRSATGNNGWSRIGFQGQTGYVVTDYVTTDTTYVTPGTAASEFNTIFTEVNEEVTAKDVTNLRDMPSVEEPSQVITQFYNGDVAVRTGVAGEGWSRVEYNGQVLYCISSYLSVLE